MMLGNLNREYLQSTLMQAIMTSAMSNKEISAAALKLPRKSRARLAEELLDSLSGEAQREIDAAWAREVEARIADLDSGKSKTKPVSKVLRQLRSRHRNDSRN
jgi:putative addiction module component (TIGR02574 family)